MRFGEVKLHEPIWQGTAEQMSRDFPTTEEPLPVWRWVKDAVSAPPQVSATFILYQRPHQDSAWRLADADPRLA